MTQTIIKAKASFEECTPDQIATILARRYFSTIKKIGEIEYKESLVLMLVEGMTQKKLNLMDYKEKVRHFNYIRWAFNDTIKTRPFDVLKIKGRHFIFPQENFSDTTSIEFAMANIFYLVFTNPKDDIQKLDSLYDLMAIFIRPRAEQRWLWKREKIREAYDSKRAERTATFLHRNLPFGLTLAFLQWFEFTNNAFLERNKELLEGGDGRPLFFNGEGWLAMLEDIAESRVFGDFDQVCTKPVHNIFMYLRHTKTKLNRQIEEQEAANKFEPA